MFHRMLKFLIIALVIITSHRTECAQPSDIIPPVPDRIITRIQERGHPLLLADRIHFRKTRNLINKPFFEERRDEFRDRVEAYVDKESPGWLGEGPFDESDTFNPKFLNDENMAAYTQALCEIACEYGLKQEKWAEKGLQIEFYRLLDYFEPQESISEMGFPVIEFDARQAALLALDVILYDTIYNRIDTIDRHDPNQRFKRILNRLSVFCSTSEPDRFSPEEKTLLGAALGMTALFCISVYPFEWEKDELFAVQTFLPDLYRAVTLTREGMENLVTEDNQFRHPLPYYETILHLAIPWIECMKRMGYPHIGRKETYTKIVSALEAHRVPGSSHLVLPRITFPMLDPWAPDSSALFMVAAPPALPEEDAELEEGKETESPIEPPPNPGLVGPVSALDYKDSLNDGMRRLTLREQLEMYMQPRPKTFTPPKEPPTPQEREAGWRKPVDLKLPPVWGPLYLLASRDDPDSNAGVVWADYAADTDSHPYTFLYWHAPSAPSGANQYTTDFVSYPRHRFALFSNHTPRGSFMLGSQAAKQTIWGGTVVIDHDSFFAYDNETKWRWHHEIPSSTESISSATEIAPSTYVIPLIETGSVDSPQEATPFITPIYSCWNTFSPTGRTIAVHRHQGGIGPPISVIAHFPEKSSSAKRIEYINVQLPDESVSAVDDEIPGSFFIIPKDAQEEEEYMSLEEWKLIRNAERAGAIKTEKTGILNLLFSPDSIRKAGYSTGVMGRFFEAQLANPKEPFFYCATVEQRGREKFELKYAILPLPGIRVLEWRAGLEIIAINMGKGIDNEFVKSDADLVVLSRNRVTKRFTYLMVNGSYLRAKFSPMSDSYELFADTKGRALTAAWCNRRVYTDAPPRSMSVFHSPDAIGFECPGTMVEYGRKGNQIVVWGKKKEK